MRLELTRGPQGRTETTMTRPDGVTVRLRGYDRADVVPHDLAHLATERTFGLRGGLWGLVASGVVLDSVEVVSGRQRHDWRDRSRRLLAAHGDELATVELLNGVVHFHALGRVADLEGALREAWGSRSAEPYPFGRSGTDAAADLARLAERWRALPRSGVLVEDWPLPPLQLTGRRRGR